METTLIEKDISVKGIERPRFIILSELDDEDETHSLSMQLFITLVEIA